MKLRVLELGSNSFQLHGFTVSTGGIVRGQWGVKRVVRLARGVSKDGVLDAEYASRGVSAVQELLDSSRDQTPLVAVATSAVREAKNRELLFGPLAARWGIEPRVLSGSDEARMAFAGALASMDTAVGRVCVVDIGGGSTENAFGDNRGVEFTHSERIGTLANELERASFRTRLGLVLARVAQNRPERVIFASGSARALRRILISQGIVAEGSSLPTALVERLAPMLPAIPSAELSALGVGADRHATLASGAGLVLDVVRALGVSFFDVAEGGLREGVAIAEWRAQQCLRSIERLGGERSSVENLVQHFARFGEPVELPRRALASGG